MKNVKKLVSVVLIIGLVTMMVAGCSSGSTKKESSSTNGLQKVTLQLKWLPQSQFMGYYVAKEKGYYEAEGIDLEILPGGSDIIPEQQVSNGVADIGVTWLSSLMKYQSQGWDLIDTAQIFQKSGMLLVSKASTGITTPADLRGKKVSSWFGGNEYEIYALLEANGINKDKDLTMVQQDYTMNQLINNEVDAASAMTYNEYGLLLESGLKETDLNKIDMNDAGVAMMEDCLFVSKDWIAENEDLYVRFLRASIKGWADACADPDAAGKTVYNVDQSVSLDHQIYMANEVKKLVEPAGFDAEKIGYIDMNAVQQTADLSYKYGLLTQKAVISDATVNSKYWEEATK